MPFENFNLILKDKFHRSRVIQEAGCFLPLSWYSLTLHSKRELNLLEIRKSARVHKTCRCIAILVVVVFILNCFQILNHAVTMIARA